jgi:nicotinamidase-related amidase
MIPALKKRVSEARENGVKVVYVCDSHAPDDPEFKAWPRHAVAGSRGSRIVEELTPLKEDLVVKKKSYSSFYQTELNKLLRELGVEKLTITGVCTSICVLYTAVDAFMRGYGVMVPEDSVTGLTPDDHGFALRQIKEVLKPVTQ